MARTSTVAKKIVLDPARLAAGTDRPPRRGCATCAGGAGPPLSALPVTYPGGRTRQFSLRRAQVGEVRRWLGNYHRLKEALEAICELNHDLLRPDGGAPRGRRKKGD